MTSIEGQQSLRAHYEKMKRTENVIDRSGDAILVGFGVLAAVGIAVGRYDLVTLTVFGGPTTLIGRDILRELNFLRYRRLKKATTPSTLTNL